MSVTGICLILFLTFHCAMNVAAFFSGDAYNTVCEFLGANWYAVAGTLGLAFLACCHIVYAFILTAQNRRARGDQRYEVTNRRPEVSWASQNMLVLGLIVVVGILLHLYNFWAHMMLAEFTGAVGACAPADGFGWIKEVFLPGLFCALPHLDCRPVVPPDPRLLVGYADLGLERKDLVEALAGHRCRLCHRFTGCLCHPRTELLAWLRSEHVLTIHSNQSLCHK